MLSSDDRRLISRDPSLPGLARLLDPEEVGGVLATVADGVDTLVPTYARYKPGTSCLVGFEARTAGGSVPVHAIALAGDANAKLNKIADEARVEGRLGFKSIVDTDIVVLEFPNDHDLPSMRCLETEDSARMLVERVLEDRTVASCDVHVLRYKPGRRCVLRVAEAARSPLVLRLQRASGFEAANRVSRLFQSRGRLVTPARVGRSVRHHIMAWSWLPGETILEPARADGAAIGEALSLLHEQDGRDQAPRIDALGELERTVHAIEAIAPRLSAVSRDVARSCEAALGAPDSIGLLHGDLDLSQIVHQDDRIGLVDLDRGGVGDRRYDVGRLIGGAIARGAELDEVGRLGAEITEAYRACSGVDVRSGLGAFVAADLLARAVEPFRRRRSAWLDAMSRHVTIAMEFARSDAAVA